MSKLLSDEDGDTIWNDSVETRHSTNDEESLREILYNVANFYSGRKFSLDGGDYEGVENALAAIQALQDRAVAYQLKTYMSQRCGCLNCDAIADDFERLTLKSEKDM